jgi:hypothetical protein
MLSRACILSALLGCVACAGTPAPQTERLVLGGTHRLIQTDEQDGFVEPAEEEFILFRALAAPFRDSDGFRGTARARSKTTLPDAEVEIFPSVVALRATLESDAEMRDGDPAITHGRDSDRVAEEHRMVRVRTQLIAVSREEDNDYHLIVADAGCRRASCRMNVEISGLPGTRSEHYAALRAARTQFDDAVEGPIGSGYAFFEPPAPVVIEGALFYDLDHAPGLVGPAQARPDTSWEIHPISSIEFVD